MRALGPWVLCAACACVDPGSTDGPSGTITPPHVGTVSVHDPVEPLVPTGTPWEWDLPLGFPAPVVPVDDPMTAEKVELGRHLFYDTRLSGNGTQACASCHEQARAFTDGRALPLGSTGVDGVRNAMGLSNVAYHSTLTWASPVLVQLEQQAPVPMFGETPVELGITGHEEDVLALLAEDPDYGELFAAAYPRMDPDERVDWDPIVGALASFVRALVSFDTPYDRFAYGGDSSAMTDSQKRGMQLFFGEKLECHHCHGSPMFSNSFVTVNSAEPERPFFNDGLYNIDGEGAYPPDNTGLYAFTGQPWDMGKFRPPSLRNLAYTAPYMHDGSVATLDKVLDMYANGGRLLESGPYAGDGSLNPYKSAFLIGFELTAQERRDVLAFLLEGLRDDTLVDDPRFSDPFTP
ncbi:MAG: di-heme enzyme [Myxococcales bacterium]|nr:di-heme enzyme [Myxococcales bacterium]